MISCGMILIDILIYSGLYIGVPRYKFEISSVKYLAPGVDKTDFHKILMVGRSDDGVLTSYRQTILSPPTVSLDLLGSALCGFYATTIRP